MMGHQSRQMAMIFVDIESLIPETHLNAIFRYLPIYYSAGTTVGFSSFLLLSTGPLLYLIVPYCTLSTQAPPRRSVGGRKQYRTQKPPIDGTLPRKEQQSGTLYLHRPTVEAQ